MITLLTSDTHTHTQREISTMANKEPITSEWIESKQKQYNHFSDVHLLENIGNESFYHFKAGYNVFACTVHDDPHILKEINPVQIFNFQTTSQQLRIYILQEGMIRVPSELDKWKALGNFRKQSNKNSFIELNFF